MAAFVAALVVGASLLVWLTDAQGISSDFVRLIAVPVVVVLIVPAFWIASTRRSRRTRRMVADGADWAGAANVLGGRGALQLAGEPWSAFVELHGSSLRVNPFPTSSDKLGLLPFAIDLRGMTFVSVTPRRNLGLVQVQRLDISGPTGGVLLDVVNATGPFPWRPPMS